MSYLFEIEGHASAFKCFYMSLKACHKMLFISALLLQNIMWFSCNKAQNSLIKMNWPKQLHLVIFHTSCHPHWAVSTMFRHTVKSISVTVQCSSLTRRRVLWFTVFISHRVLKPEIMLTKYKQQISFFFCDVKYLTLFYDKALFRNKSLSPWTRVVGGAKYANSTQEDPGPESYLEPS